MLAMGLLLMREGFRTSRGPSRLHAPSPTSRGEPRDHARRAGRKRENRTSRILEAEVQAAEDCRPASAKLALGRVPDRVLLSRRRRLDSGDRKSVVERK